MLNAEGVYLLFSIDVIIKVCDISQLSNVLRL